MKRFVSLLIIFVIFIILTVVVILKSPLAKHPISLYLSNVLKSDVAIKECNFSFTTGAKFKDLEIKSKKGLYCTVKDGEIKYDILGLLKNNLVLDCSLKSVEFSHSSSPVIKGITHLFGMGEVDLFNFDTVKGSLYIKPKEFIIKDLNARGKDISFFANGTTKDNKYITYSLKLMLSENITSKIPEDIRKIFFKQEQEYSIVELYLNGSLKKPSINFSTPLFKLSIR